MSNEKQKQKIKDYWVNVAIKSWQQKRDIDGDISNLNGF